MTGKIKRRSLRCGGRPKADFGSIFTTFIAPALGVAGSVADSAISKAQASKSNIKPAVKETNTEVTNNNTSVENLPTTQAPTKEPISGLVTSNTVIPPDPTKTPTMRLGGRKKCWIGAAIMGATSIAGSLFGAAAQKREMRRQKSIKDWQDTTQEAANMTSALNNSQDYQEDYLRQFRTAARLGKTLGAKGIYITDGGDATKIDNNTYLLRGGSHEDVNETGQTGIGINVGGNEVEAEGGEVAQKKNGALRIFSAQPILGNGMSPAQAILRGYNKDKVFSQQQAFKKRNGLKDDGSKAQWGMGVGTNRALQKSTKNGTRSIRSMWNSAKIPLSYTPIVGTAMDGYQYIRKPSVANFVPFTIGLASDIAGMKWLKGTGKATNYFERGLKSSGHIRSKRAPRGLIAGTLELDNTGVNYIQNKKRLGGGLTSKDRGSSKHPYPTVSSKDFAGGGRSYPIPTKADAVDALRLAGLHGRSDVKAKVYSRYPELRKKAEIGTVVPGGIPGTDSYKQRMYSGYDVSPADLLNLLEYLDRAAGRKDFIYRAGKYQKYTTNKETDAKKERLNRIIGARRMAKALGGYSLPVKGMRPKAAIGIHVPFNKRYTSIYDAPDYDDINGGNVLGNKEVTVTAKRIKPTFLKPNNDAMDIINHPANGTPYIPQKHNRSRTIFSGGDYLGLGIDTLAALSTGLVNYNTAGKYVLPDRAPIIQASKLPTTYNVAPEIEEVKRYRDRLTGETYRNTSSSVAALNRGNTINLDALSNLSKLWATKENEENKMLTEDAKNQQTVAAQNVQNELARQSEIARIKNEAIQAKGDALNVGLSGLSQAWTNFWTAGRTAYEDDQTRRAMIASSKEATPTRLMETNFDLSPDVIASLYKTAKDDRTKRFYLSRLSPKQRQKYGIN